MIACLCSTLNCHSRTKRGTVGGTECFIDAYCSYTYTTAGNIGCQLNLAVWRLGKRPANLNPSNLSAIYVNKGTRNMYGTTAKFKSANIFISAARGQPAKFKDRQYFRLYSIKLMVHLTQMFLTIWYICMYTLH